MTTALLPAYMHPTVEVTEPSDGHWLPFTIAVLIFALSSLGSIWLTGLPS